MHAGVFGKGDFDASACRGRDGVWRKEVVAAFHADRRFRFKPERDFRHRHRRGATLAVFVSCNSNGSGLRRHLNFRRRRVDLFLRVRVF